MGTVVDADVLIGFLEGDDAHHPRAVHVLEPVLSATSETLISAVTYSEILVRPLLTGTGDHLDAFLAAAKIVIVNVDPSIATEAAALRGRHRNLRLPDAIVLATARRHNAKLLTFDARLRRLAA